MAWRFLDKILFIDRGLVDAVKCSADVLNGWNGSDEVYYIGESDILQLGDVKVGRSIGSASYGLNGVHDTWMHFYNEGNNWYYRALVIYKNGSDVVHYTQITQSYNYEFYYGIAVNDDVGRAALIQVCINTNDNSFVNATAWFYASGTFTFEDFYNAFRNGDPHYGSLGAGAGSGYIGNSLVSNKKMVGYNVPTSSAESTKTESVNEASELPVSGKPKIGNGHAKVKFLRGFRNIEFINMFKTQDLTHRQTANNLGWYGGGVPASLSQYVNTDWIMGCGVHSDVAYLEQDGEYILDGSRGHDTYMLYPIKSNLIGKRVLKVNIKALLYNTEGYSNSVFSNIGFIDADNNNEYQAIQAFNYNAGSSSDRTIYALDTWYSFSVDMSGFVLPNYLQMYVAVGKWKFKDVTFEVEE